MKRFLLIAAILSLFSCSASAFQCTAIDNGPSLYWAERTVPFVLDPAGTANITGTLELNTLRAAFKVWNEVECSDLNWVESTASYDGKVGFDYLEPQNNQNSLTFHDENWPYSSLIIALTTVTANNCTGQILDADIEFNSDDYTFTNSNILVKTDLLNTAVHEIGHMIGLDHTTTVNNVMYPYASNGETRCRTLFQDDIDAICFKYPRDGDLGFCYDNDNCKDNCRQPGSCDDTIITTITIPRGCNATSQNDVFLPLILLLVLWIKQSCCSSARQPRPDRE